ncbi:MAG: RHS repeat domain-containing protein, partial [Gemmataceae bacterium]
QYDAVSNIVAITDRNGRTRTFDHDALDRMTRESWLDGTSVVRTLDFTYDAIGNMLTASDPDSSYAFTYDAVNRVTSVDNAGTPLLPHLVLTYGYDAVGNITSISDNYGVIVQSTYDARDLLLARTWQGGGIDPARVGFSYNDRGERVQVQRFADLTGTFLVGTSEMAYDPVGQLTSLVHRNGSGSMLADYVYTYDLAGQLTFESHHGQSSDYNYDPTGQLTGALHTGQPDENYFYDANGNRIGGDNVVGPNNQILSDGIFNYEYDFEGNLILKTEIATGNYTSFEYDHRNRLTEVVEHTSSGLVLNEVRYTYDVFDRRIVETVNGQTVTHAFDGENVWADFDAAGNVLARYLFGDRVDEIIARFRPGEGTNWYLTDKLFTVRDIVSSAGAVINHIDYNSFGKVIFESNQFAGDRFKFTGREFEPITGLYYYRARFYDPSIGRFISQDPLRFEAGDANFYRYVSNSPLNFTDPTGLTSFVERVLANRVVAVLVLTSACVGLDLAIGYLITEQGPTWPDIVISVGTCAFAALTAVSANQFVVLGLYLQLKNFLLKSWDDVAEAVFRSPFTKGAGKATRPPGIRPPASSPTPPAPRPRPSADPAPPRPPARPPAKIPPAQPKNTPRPKNPKPPDPRNCFTAGHVILMAETDVVAADASGFAWDDNVWMAAAIAGIGVVGWFLYRRKRQREDEDLAMPVPRDDEEICDVDREAEVVAGIARSLTTATLKRKLKI